MNNFDSVVEENKVIVLPSGGTVPMPKLTTLKTIRLAKFFASDAYAIYAKTKGLYRNVPKLDENNQPIVDENGKQEMERKGPNEQEVFEFILAELSEEMLAKIISMIIDVPEDQVLNMDFADTLVIVTDFIENTNINKAFLAIKNLTAKFRPTVPEEIQTEIEEQPQATNQSVVPLPNMQQS